ncbi:MAG: hypothetical protein NZL95_01550 [Chitinophagales bacterium]|nr:hypothetical protein [Chitinophagales bacterium]MDW8427220.1 hypothetical protein [Chitinophagales bacterium]
MHRRVLLLVGIMAASACRIGLQGTLLENQAPETYLIVDTIIRSGNDRLSAQVQIHWWGNDPDGYIIGYEFTTGGDAQGTVEWHFTSKQDSTFLLTIPPGADSVDVPFRIRAIDHLGLADPTPAQLTFPIKNSPPTVQFRYAENNPLKSFPVLRFYWEGSDPDGVQDLLRYELCWNDTLALPYSVPATTTSAVFEAVDPKAMLTDCRVYYNNITVAAAELMPGLITGDTNVLYVRAVDQAEAQSPWMAAKPVLVKRPLSDVLIVDGYISNGNTVTAFYRDQLNAIGIAEADTLQLFEKIGNTYTQQSADYFTQAKVFALFQRIIWFTNDAARSLSIGQRCLNDFFNANGRLLMSVYVSSLFDEQSDFLDFTPLSNFIVPSDTTLLLTDTSMIFSLKPGFPDLQSSAYVGVVRPFELVPGAEPLYKAELIAKDNSNLTLSLWQGPSVVMASKANSAGQTHFIFSTLELHRLNGLGNMHIFFDHVFNTLFDW